MSDPGLSDLNYSFLMAEWKVERATQHISYVEEIVRWMVDPSNYVVGPEHDIQSGCYGLRIGPKAGGMPHELPVAIGDALHNLTSALDYVWAAVERQVSPGLVNRRAHFPRHETRQNLADLMTSKTAIKAVFPQVEPLILDTIKPYKTGNFSLWILGKLNNIDKHRLLLATYCIINFGKFVATSEDGSVIDLSGSSIQTEGPVFSLGFTAPFKLNDDAEFAADIVFAEDDLRGRPILKTLADFTRVTSETIQIFRDALTGARI